MTIFRLLVEYEKKLRQAGHLARQASEFSVMNSNDNQEVLDHALWMCQRVTAVPMDYGKQMRWLGCIQGILLATGNVTIAELKRRTAALLVGTTNTPAKKRRPSKTGREPKMPV